LAICGKFSRERGRVTNLIRAGGGEVDVGRSLGAKRIFQLGGRVHFDCTQGKPITNSLGRGGGGRGKSRGERIGRLLISGPAKGKENFATMVLGSVHGKGVPD